MSEVDKLLLRITALVIAVTGLIATLNMLAAAGAATRCAP